MKLKQSLFATALLVSNLSAQDCVTNYNRLLVGPVDVTGNAKSGNIYVDNSFYRMR